MCSPRSSTFSALVTDRTHPQQTDVLDHDAFDLVNLCARLREGVVAAGLGKLGLHKVKGADTNQFDG